MYDKGCNSKLRVYDKVNSLVQGVVQAGEVETPAMAAEAGRETRRGAESDERRATDAMGHKIEDSARVRVRNTYAY